MGLKERLKEFGKEYGFIPRNREKIRDDFNFVDYRLHEIAYEVKREIEDYFERKEGVIPYHWHKVKVYLAHLPTMVEYAIDRGKKVLKGIGGTLGMYSSGNRSVYINRYLLDLDNENLKKSVLRHELFHSIQDEAGSFDREPRWKIEAEASMFGVGGFEETDFWNTEKPVPYRPWALQYIWRWGKRLMTSFKERMKRFCEYFTEDELDGM